MGVRKQQDDMQNKILRWWTEMDPDADNQNMMGWQKSTDTMPRQRNMDGTPNVTDCGVLTCLAMRRLMLCNRRPRSLEDWQFTGTNGSRGRYRITNELAANKIFYRTKIR